MSEAELHILRARLDGGIRNKAARGELRRGLPVGLVWGEADGEIRWHPDEAVTGVIAAIFDRFAVCGSVRGVWLWLREQGLRFPLQPAAYLRGQEITWVEPTYHAVHNVLTHPAYAGAYVFGKTRQQRHLGADGVLRTRRRKLPQGEWEVLIPDHHRGFIDWDTYQANQARIGANTRPRAHQPGTGAVREGCALLQGLATCGICGRKLAVYYDGPAKATPGYYCTGTGQLVDGRGTRHLRVGGVAIDTAVAAAFLAALQPSALQACLAAAQQLEDGHDTALAQWRRQVEQARYHAGKAERRYRAVDPDNRLVARGLETEWNTALQQLADAENELARRETARPTTLTPHEKQAILALGDDLAGVWSAADHHRQGPQEAAAHPARRGRHRRAPRPRPRPRRPRPALEGRRDHRTVRAAQAETAAAAAHRRGHHRPAAPAGRPLPRRHHRRDPQPATPPHRPRTVVHRQ